MPLSVWKYLVPEIFKFDKCVKYANERTDDVINSKQYNIKNNYINRAVSVIFAAIDQYLQEKPLKLARVIGLHATHLRL